jgi:hypothetical protein
MEGSLVSMEDLRAQELPKGSQNFFLLKLEIDGDFCYVSEYIASSSGQNLIVGNKN